MTSAQRKLGRGAELVRILLEEADDYEESEAYVFSNETERRSPQEMLYRCFAEEHRPPPDHWPLLAGDAVQNLRASLDHAVWSAWKEAGNSGDGDHTQFPITTVESRFRKQAGHSLEGVPPSVIRTIEAAQPYNKAPERPERDLLELLRKLSNTDKHRTLATVASAVTRESIGTWGEVEITDWQPGSWKALGPGKIEVSSFTLRAKSDVADHVASPEFHYEVQIEGIPLGMLYGITHRVFEVVGECETGRPASPSAIYPLQDFHIRKLHRRSQRAS